MMYRVLLEIRVDIPEEDITEDTDLSLRIDEDFCDGEFEYMGIYDYHEEKQGGSCNKEWQLKGLPW